MILMMMKLHYTTYIDSIWVGTADKHHDRCLSISWWWSRANSTYTGGGSVKRRCRHCGSGLAWSQRGRLLVLPLPNSNSEEPHLGIRFFVGQKLFRAKIILEKNSLNYSPGRV